jgi:7-carboxy-7-deazaguanine synthase
MLDGRLNIIEVFASVQGETSLTGLPTTFVRLAACNLRCTWCDTAYSFGRGVSTEIQLLLKQVQDYGCKHVCITGGEPLLQEQVHPFMTELCDRGFILSLETGGSLSTAKVDPRVRVILDVKCPGSGMSEKNLWKNLDVLQPHDEVKFVIAGKQDYLFALEICKKHSLFSANRQVLFSPVHGILDPQELVKWILADKLPVRLNLQIHKFIWHPQTRGV